jgi:quinol monooxygenase YgiN
MNDRNNQVHVVAQIHGQPAQIEALAAVLKELAQGSREEAGNLGFSVHQSASEPARFVTVEQWADAAAVDAHMQSSRVGAVLARLGPLLAGPPEIVRYVNVI